MSKNKSISLKPEEKRKLNDYLRTLEDSGVGEIIAEAVDKDPKKGGRPSYNPYRLLAAMLYAFSKHSGSLNVSTSSNGGIKNFWYTPIAAFFGKQLTSTPVIKTSLS